MVDYYFWQVGNTPRKLGQNSTEVVQVYLHTASTDINMAWSHMWSVFDRLCWKLYLFLQIATKFPPFSGQTTADSCLSLHVVLKKLTNPTMKYSLTIPKASHQCTQRGIHEEDSPFTATNRCFPPRGCARLSVKKYNTLNVFGLQK